MKASFMILPALLMSAAVQKRAGGGASRDKGAEPVPPSRAPKRSWFGWVWARWPEPKKLGGPK